MTRRHYKLFKRLSLTYTSEERPMLLGRRISYLIRLFAKEDTLCILDDGCGQGEIARQLSGLGNVIGVDPSTNRVPGWKNTEKISFISASGELLPLKSHSVHVVVSQMVIEHVDCVNDYLREICHVLKPEGFLVLAGPNRVFPIEGHTKLPFITYLPETAFQKIVDAFARRKYPVNRFTYKSLFHKVKDAGFTHIYDLTPELIHKFFTDRNGLFQIVSYFYCFFKFILPSWVWICYRIDRI